MAFKLKGYNYPGKSPHKFIPPRDVNPSIGVQIGADLGGENIGGEYALSQEEMITPGIKQKLREENSNIKFVGEHKKTVEEKRAKEERMGKRGKVKDWETGEYKKVRRGKGIFG